MGEEYWPLLVMEKPEKLHLSVHTLSQKRSHLMGISADLISDAYIFNNNLTINIKDK